jgi:hypothetical protein
VVAITKPDEAYCSRPEDRDVQLDVNWFYRPEEAVGGRKVRHAGGRAYAGMVFKVTAATAAAGGRTCSSSSISSTGQRRQWGAGR